MDRDMLEQTLIDYLDGGLPQDEQRRVEEHLASNPEARRMLDQLRMLFSTIEKSSEPVPSSDLSDRVYQMLALEEGRLTKTFQLRPWIYRIAAAVALIITGVGIGYWISLSDTSSNRAVAGQTAFNKQEVLEQLNNELSPTQRIQGVLTGSEQKQPDPDIVNALVQVMNNDPNSNVRLAALEALSTFRGEKKVRNALVTSLGTQTDPVVQLALIQLMVEMKEREAIQYLRELTEDESVLPAVQDEAHAGIIRLS